MRRLLLSAWVVATIWVGAGVPHALAAKMYWTDDFTDKIQRANLDGSSIEDLVTTAWVTPSASRWI